MSNFRDFAFESLGNIALLKWNRLLMKLISTEREAKWEVGDGPHKHLAFDRILVH